MRFVDDQQLRSIPHRRVLDHLLEFANVVDTGTRCGVHLEHIHRAAFGNFDTGCAGVAGSPRRALFAVQTFGKDAGGGGFARPAQTGENVGMGQAVGFDGVAECARYVRLTDKFLESMRPPFASQNLVHARPPVAPTARAAGKGPKLPKHL